MRRSTALCMVAYLAFSTPTYAQQGPTDQRTPAVSSTMVPRARAALLLELKSVAAPNPASSLVASATRAASRMEFQPTSAPRQGRNKGRLYGGLAMLCLSPLFLLAAAAHGADDPTAAGVLGWSGIALGVGGGIMMARADSTSPISVRDGKPDEPGQRFLSRTEPVDLPSR